MSSQEFPGAKSTFIGSNRTLVLSILWVKPRVDNPNRNTQSEPAPTRIWVGLGPTLVNPQRIGFLFEQPAGYPKTHSDRNHRIGLGIADWFNPQTQYKSISRIQYKL